MAREERDARASEARRAEGERKGSVVELGGSGEVEEEGEEGSQAVRPRRNPTGWTPSVLACGCCRSPKRGFVAERGTEGKHRREK